MSRPKLLLGQPGNSCFLKFHETINHLNFFFKHCAAMKTQQSYSELRWHICAWLLLFMQSWAVTFELWHHFRHEMRFILTSSFLSGRQWSCQLDWPHLLIISHGEHFSLRVIFSPKSIIADDNEKQLSQPAYRSNISDRDRGFVSTTH